MARASALVLLAAASCVSALNNGLGLTPPMGFSSWNAVSSNVTSAFIRNITRLLIDSGLAALGYEYVNVDEGWLASRDPVSGALVEDRAKFPEGMAALGEWIHAQETAPGSGRFMKYGLYTCRGSCQCSEWDYHAPGGEGHEVQDTNWIVAAGADYLKIDSCCASQDHATAFAQYGLWRDALNATGKPVYLSICGWREWYAPPDPSLGYGGGYTLGNQWRIEGDGDTWSDLSKCANGAAALRQYSGPGGWSDPDLLIGPNGVADGTYATDLQARTQVNLWSVISAPLLISNNLLVASAYNLESYGNPEVIAVDQDPLGIAGYRLAGGNLSYPCTPGGLPPNALFAVQALPCNGSDPAQRWVQAPAPGVSGGVTIGLASNPTGALLDAYACGTADGTGVYVYPPDDGGGTCGGRNQAWKLGAPATPGSSAAPITNAASGACLDVYDFAGPTVDTWSCNGGPNQQFSWSTGTSSSSSSSLSSSESSESALPGAMLSTPAANGHGALCLAAVTPSPQDDGCTNVWGRPLHDGSAAFVFVNNGPSNTTITCDSACFAAMNMTAGSLAIRDLWAHAVVATLQPPFSYAAEVPAEGGSVIFRAIPQ